MGRKIIDTRPEMPELLEPPPPPEARTTSEPLGRRLCEFKSSKAQWFQKGLILENALNCIIGMPRAGKSTYGAFLCGCAKRPTYLPASEEMLQATVIPRLQAACDSPADVQLLSSRRWVLPRDTKLLASAVRSWDSDLLFIDTIDSHYNGSLSDAAEVRPMLEGLMDLAVSEEVTVVYGRHPGKGKGNLCPDSRAWKAVPRSFALLHVESTDPDIRIISNWDCSLSGVAKPRYYKIEDVGGVPMFMMGDTVSSSPHDESDAVENMVLQQAEQFLRHVLAEDEIQSSRILAMAKAEDISGRTLRRAGKAIGVQTRREGQGEAHRSFWFLDKK